MDAQNPKPGPRTRSAGMVPVQVSHIFNSTNPESPAKPIPSEHIGSPPTPTSKAGSEQSPKTAFSPGNKRWSSSTANRTKITTFSYPVQPSKFASPYRPSEASDESTKRMSRHLPVAVPRTSDEPDVLTALAAQERKVLELREELQKAEENLKKLKKQWATQEATKKRSEARQMQHMRPMSVSLVKSTAVPDDTDGSSAWMYDEMERRKALLRNSKTSRRRVFSGSRQTRTLSLLSPDGINGQSFPRPGDVDEPVYADANDHTPRPLRPATIPNLSTLEDDTSEEQTSPRRQGSASPSREAFVRTSMQMATDIRDGFRTFFEDLRQVTVGEEARQAPAQEESGAPGQRDKTLDSDNKPTSKLQKRGSMLPKHTVKPDDDAALIDVGGSFWKEIGSSADSPAFTTVADKRLSRQIPKPSYRNSTLLPKPKTRTLTDADTETWEPWSSLPSNVPQNAEVSGHTLTSRKSSHTHSRTNSGSDAVLASTGPTSPGKLPVISGNTAAPPEAPSRLPRVGAIPRIPRPTNERNVSAPMATTASKRESIGWSSMSKLGPVPHLKRTATHLMAEWERNLTPPGEGEGAEIW